MVSDTPDLCVKPPECFPRSLRLDFLASWTLSQGLCVHTSPPVPSPPRRRCSHVRDLSGAEKARAQLNTCLKEQRLLASLGCSRLLRVRGQRLVE